MGDVVSLSAARVARTPPHRTFFADPGVVEWLAKNRCPVAALTYLYLSRAASPVSRLTTMTEDDLRDAAGWDWTQPFFTGELARLERCGVISRVACTKGVKWRVLGARLVPVGLEIFKDRDFISDSQIRFGWRQFLPAFFKIGLGRKYKLPPLPSAADALAKQSANAWTDWAADVVATMPDRCGHAAVALAQLADSHGDVEVSIETLSRAAGKTHQTLQHGVNDLIAAGRLEKLWKNVSGKPSAYRLNRIACPEARRA